MSKKYTTEEFKNKYNISKWKWENEKQHVLEELKEYIDFKVYKKGRNIYYEILEEKKEFTGFRESYKRDKIEEDYFEYLKGIEDITNYTAVELAQMAMDDFGKEKYHHTNANGISDRYIKNCLERLNISRVALKRKNAKQSVGEKKISKILTENNIKFEIEKWAEIEGKNYYFDFYIEDWNTFIEYDGSQHFHYNIYVSKEEFLEIKRKDKVKNKWCKDNGYLLIRIPFVHKDVLTFEDLNPKTSTFVYE